MKIIAAIAEGLFWSCLFAVGLWLTLPGNYLETQADAPFARRWDGTCTGWTKPLALLHVIGDFATWCAYVIIAIVIARLHPIMARVRYSKITVPLIVAVFISCGAVHLIDAYATFHPIYEVFGWYKVFAGLIGIAGAVFIAHNLVTAFALVKKEQQRLRELEARLRGE